MSFSLTITINKLFAWNTNPNRTPNQLFCKSYIFAASLLLVFEFQIISFHLNETKLSIMYALYNLRCWIIYGAYDRSFVITVGPFIELWERSSSIKFSIKTSKAKVVQQFRHTPPNNISASLLDSMLLFLSPPSTNSFRFISSKRSYLHKGQDLMDSEQLSPI